MTIKITKLDEAFAHIDCNPAEIADLEAHFAFFVPNHQLVLSAIKKKRKTKKIKWDGKIRLFSPLSGKILYGLIPKVVEYAEWKGYRVDVSVPLPDFDRERVLAFWKNLKSSRAPRDYQQEIFVQCVKEERVTCVSPTGSGKSFSQWLLTEYYDDGPALVVVPNVGLVHQMAGDFAEYSFGASDPHLIYEGQERKSDKRVVISTWQSLIKFPKEYFERFKTVIVDEAHLAQAASLRKIMGACTNASRRFGFTGSLDDALTHKLIIEGLFGPAFVARETYELIEDEVLAEIKVEAIVVKHPPREFSDYHDEVFAIAANEKRNLFLKNLTATLNGNTLVLFEYVERHGKLLYDLIKGCGKPVYLVYGGVKGEERDEIRKLVDGNHNSVIIGSFGSCSTGINIVNLHNIILASTVKGRIRLKQSIGRGTRRNEETKLSCTIYDVADDFRAGRHGDSNYTLDHFRTRLRLYAREKFPVKFHVVRL